MEKRYLLQIEVKEEEFAQVMDELEKAQEKIMECYLKLKRMGVLVIRKGTAERTAAPEAVSDAQVLH